VDQLALNWEPRRNQFTVSELTFRINEIFARDLADVWVAGEISGAKQSPAGHWYFNLKDEGAQLQCACFKMTAMRLRVKPQDGLAVLARGHIEVYAQRGQHQLIVDAIEPQGLGALQLAFEQLKKKLAAEGLFDPARKRPLPKHPRRIGIVTSTSGAAIQDLLKVLRRRAPMVTIRIYPAQVQGDGAAKQIARGIDYFSSSGWADVVITGRGGGSLEDLWAFNEEIVARAIHRSNVPVVAAVGHETDFTIAEFVADLRASTPSAAAEIVSAGWVALPEALAAETRHLKRAMTLVLTRAADRLGRQGIDRARMVLRLRMNRLEQRVDDCDARQRESIRATIAGRLRRLEAWTARLARRDPRVRIAEGRMRLDRSKDRLESGMRRALALRRPRLESLAAALAQLSPFRVLDRGYAIVRDDSGKALKSPPTPGTRLRIRYAEGEGCAAATPDDSSELPS
jgi:exodeoxyribonuclease VII large subunit